MENSSLLPWKLTVPTAYLSQTIIDDYIKKGQEIGEAQKKAEVNERVATDMIRDKKPLEEILKYSKLPEAAIRKLADSMGVAVL